MRLASVNIIDDPAKDLTELFKLFLSALALFLKRTLEFHLAKTIPELSGTEAIAALRSVGLAELDLGGRIPRLVSAGGRDARRVLSALGISDVNPPTPKTST